MDAEKKQLIKRRMDVVNELLNKSIQDLFDDGPSEQPVMDAYWQLGEAKEAVNKGVTRLLE